MDASLITGMFKQKHAWFQWLHGHCTHIQSLEYPKYYLRTPVDLPSSVEESDIVCFIWSLYEMNTCSGPEFINSLPLKLTIIYGISAFSWCWVTQQPLQGCKQELEGGGWSHPIQILSSCYKCVSSYCKRTSKMYYCKKKREEKSFQVIGSVTHTKIKA